MKATQILISYMRYSGTMTTNIVIRSAWNAAMIELARRAYLRFFARSFDVTRPSVKAGGLRSAIRKSDQR
jgi:hypothetical protein